jgi:hypothetical protein
MANRSELTQQSLQTTNGVKADVNSRDIGVFPIRAPMVDVRTCVKGTVALYDPKIGQTAHQKKKGVQPFIHDLSGMGVGTDSKAYRARLKFAGIVSNNGTMQGNGVDNRVVALVIGGAFSFINMQSGPVRNAQELEWDFPVSEDPNEFKQNREHSALTALEKVQAINGMHPKKNCIRVKVWDPSSAISADKIYNEGVRDGTEKSQLVKQMAEDGAFTTAQGALLLLEQGVLTFTPIAKRRERAENFEMLTDSSRDGIIDSLFKAVDGKTRDGLEKFSHRLIKRRFGRTAKHSLFNRTEALPYKDPRNEIQLRQENHMTIHCAQLSAAFNASRSRVFARVTRDAGPGQLTHGLITSN